RSFSCTLPSLRHRSPPRDSKYCTTPILSLHKVRGTPRLCARDQEFLSAISYFLVRLVTLVSMRSEKNVSPKLLVVLLFLPAITVSAVAQADPWPLMPMPAHLQQGTGQFIVNSSFTLGFEGYREPRLDSAAARFLQRLSRQTGIPLPTAPSDSHAKFVIRCRQASAKIQEVREDESYRLEITPSDVKLEAPNPLGIIHGLQTFLQLVQIGPQGFAAPSLIIEDRPR